MKRFTILALIAAFVLGTVALAGATELKVSGEFQVHGDWADNLNFRDKDNDNTNEDDFQVQQRLRTVFNFIASENLKAVWALEVGTTYWGNGGGRTATVQGAGSNGFVSNTGSSSGGGLDTDGVNVETKWAYLDFNIPGSTVNVKAGLLPVTFPNAFGSSAVTDHDSGAIVVSAPITDMFSVTAAYTRIMDNNIGATGDGTDRQKDEVDAVLLALPITPVKGLAIVPWGAYALAGYDTLLTPAANTSTSGTFTGVAQNTGLGLGAPLGTGATEDDVTVWWAGIAVDIKMFDPFQIAFDFNYGKEDGGDLDIDRSGWMADLKVAYKGLSFGTPTLFAAYSTGEDEAPTASDPKSHRMPYLLENWYIPGAFFAGGSAFDAENGHGSDRNVANFICSGQWVVGLGLYGLTFVDKLSHDIVVAYSQGTNDATTEVATYLQSNAGGAFGVGSAMTDKDHVWEINFNTTYQIYEQLAAIAEIGYANASYDEDVWGAQADELDAAWRFLLGFKYKF